MWEGQTKRTKTACHKQVMEVAKAAAGELYEVLMSDNLIWAEWNKQNPNLSSKRLETKFINSNWPKCIEFARATLGHMLARPDMNESLKNQILEVLILDNSIPVGRIAPGRAVSLVNLVNKAKHDRWKP